MKKLAVFGPGYVGFRAALYFRKHFDVWASVRSSKSEEKIKQAGMVPFSLHLEQDDPFSGAGDFDYALIALAPDESDEENYRKVYLEGTSAILEKLKNQKTPLQKIIYLSSTGVWRDQGDGVFDESVPAKPQKPKNKILLEAENQAFQSGLPTVVLRLSGIYGAGRNRIKYRACNQSHTGCVITVPQENRYMNMIFVDDIPPLLELLFREGKAGEVYLGTDDEPTPAFDVADWLLAQGIAREETLNARQNQMSLTSPRGRRPVGKRYANAKIKALGFRPQFPNFRLGYNAIIGELKVTGVSS